MKLFDTIFFLRFLFPPVLYLGNGASIKPVLPFGKGWKESAWNPIVPLNQTQNLLRGKGLSTDKFLADQAAANKVAAAPAPAPSPATGDAVQSARTIMGKVRSRQGRAATILTSTNVDQGLKTVLGTPLQ